jgi:hypothetical protein
MNSNMTEGRGGGFAVTNSNENECRGGGFNSSNNMNSNMKSVQAREKTSEGPAKREDRVGTVHMEKEEDGPLKHPDEYPSRDGVRA